jgi:hypothetical protein
VIRPRPIHHFLYLSYPSPRFGITHPYFFRLLSPLPNLGCHAHRARSRCFLVIMCLTFVDLWYPPSILTGPLLHCSILVCISTYNSLGCYLCTYHYIPPPSPPLLSLSAATFAVDQAGLVFTPPLLILLTWIWVIRFTCVLHFAGLRAFVRLYNDASPFLYFPHALLHVTK